MDETYRGGNEWRNEDASVAALVTTGHFLAVIIVLEWIMIFCGCMCMCCMACAAMKMMKEKGSENGKKGANAPSEVN